MKTLVTAALTGAELFIAISDLIKIILMLVILYQVKSIGYAVLDYTSGVKQAAANVSMSVQDKAVSAKDAISSTVNEESVKSVISVIKNRLSD